MAIKGKGRTRSRRVIAAPPRPQLVIRKPPIWRRRWVWAILGGMALAGILAGVLTALHHRHERAFLKREAEAVQSFTNTLQKRFPKEFTIISPDVPQLFSDLQTNLNDLSSGKLSSKDAATKADALISSANRAAQGVEAVNVARLISADFTASTAPNSEATGATRQQLTDAQFLMAQGLRLYAHAGELMKSAAEAKGSQMKDLVTQAGDLASQGGGLFSRGYRSLLLIRNVLGLGSPAQAPTPTPSIPLPSVSVPVPIPSVSGSVSTSPSASPSS
jgi:hypothetical protein